MKTHYYLVGLIIFFLRSWSIVTGGYNKTENRLL